MENNYVKLSVDKYNALLLENAKLKAAIKLKKSWSDSIDVELDVVDLRDLITEKFNQSVFADKFVLNDLTDVYAPSVKIASPPPVEVKAGEDDE